MIEFEHSRPLAPCEGKENKNNSPDFNYLDNYYNQHCSPAQHFLIATVLKINPNSMHQYEQGSVQTWANEIDSRESYRRVKVVAPISFFVKSLTNGGFRRNHKKQFRAIKTFFWQSRSCLKFFLTCANSGQFPMAQPLVSESSIPSTWSFSLVSVGPKLSFGRLSMMDTNA